MIRFSCPGCGAVYSVGDEKAGKQGKCPKCQTPFTIPAAEAPAPTPPPPPPASSNPFADLDQAPVKKKTPSKADLDDDRPKKKTPPKADLDDDEDDRPKKKSRRYEDDEDDAPPPKKKARRDDDEDDAPPPKKKPSRRDDDDEDDDSSFDAKPKKKPARAEEDDYDDEDDRPRKKSRRRDDDDDYDDDYEDRPRRKPKKSGLLLAAAILHIIAAALYVPCGGIGLIGASWLGFVAGAADTTMRVGGDQVRMKGNNFEKANFAEAERLVANANTAVTLLQIVFVLALLGGLVAIVGAVGGFSKKKWFVPMSLASGGAFALVALIYLVMTIAFIPLAIGGLLLLVLLPGAYAGIVIMAAVNRNVKRVLS